MNTPDATLEQRVAALEEEVARLRGQDRLPGNRVCLICFSGDWDRLFAALTIAHGALASGQEVHLFFSFWGVSALVDPGGEPPPGLTHRLFRKLLFHGAVGTRLSRMHFLGLGKYFMRRLMMRNKVDDLDVLLDEVRALGAKLYLCETSALLLGIRKEDLAQPDSVQRCGVATFIKLALGSRIVLFI